MNKIKIAVVLLASVVLSGCDPAYAESGPYCFVAQGTDCTMTIYGKKVVNHHRYTCEQIETLVKFGNLSVFLGKTETLSQLSASTNDPDTIMKALKLESGIIDDVEEAMK